MPGRIDFFLEQRAPRSWRTRRSTPSRRRAWRSGSPTSRSGVVANISAWNYPYFVGSNVFVPALLTGNAVLYKPSELATLTGLAIARPHARGGRPRGRLHRPSSAAAPVAARAAGAAARRRLLHRLLRHRPQGRGGGGPRRSMRMQLELGGKDPVYVCDDVDVEHAAAVRGRRAPSTTRARAAARWSAIYVHQRDPRRASWTPSWRRCAAFVVGDPTDETTFIGPVTRAGAARRARGPGRGRARPRARACCWAAGARDGPGLLLRAHGARGRGPPHGADARGELRARDRRSRRWRATTRPWPS